MAPRSIPPAREPRRQERVSSTQIRQLEHKQRQQAEARLGVRLRRLGNYARSLEAGLAVHFERYHDAASGACDRTARLWPDNTLLRR